MSYFNPKIFILKNIIKKLKEKSQKRRNKYKIRREQITCKNNINKIMKKREMENVMNNYFNLKKITYDKELEEEKQTKKEINFDKLNYTFNEFARSRNNFFDIKNGIISKTNNLHQLKIDSTFGKIWAKFSPKNYEKFNDKFIFSKDEGDIILRRIKKEKEKMNSMIDLGINNFKKIFGDNAFKKVNNNKEKINSKEPIDYLLKKIKIKNSNNTTNNINADKYKQLFFNKTFNNNIGDKIKILKRENFSLKNEKLRNNSKNSSQSENKIVKLKKIHFMKRNIKPNPDLKGIITREKVNQKNFSFMKGKSIINKHSRNIKKHVIPSETQISKIYKEYDNIIKTTKEMRNKHLDNNIIPLTKVNTIMNIREELMIYSMKMKYLKEDKRFLHKLEKIKRKQANSFKKRLLRSSVLFADNETEKI